MFTATHRNAYDGNINELRNAIRRNPDEINTYDNHVC